MILSTCNCFRNSICCRRKETAVRIIKSILLPQQDCSPRIVLPYHITTQIYTTTSGPCTLAGRRPYLLMSTRASLFHTRLSVSVNNGGNKKYYGHTMSSHHGHCVQCVCLINPLLFGFLRTTAERTSLCKPGSMSSYSPSS